MSEPESTEPSPPKPQNKAAGLMKGCGCVTGLAVMMLGILVIGHWDTAAWASALTAGVVGVLVFVLSGVNGMWER
jgi:hypothetical protein